MGHNSVVCGGYTANESSWKEFRNAQQRDTKVCVELLTGQGTLGNYVTALSGANVQKPWQNGWKRKGNIC